MDLRSRSYTSAAHHWAGPLGSPLPSCEARGVWCPKARSCTWLITAMASSTNCLQWLYWNILKPCNHWHLYMTLRYTMIYSRRVQLDHFRPILQAYVDRFSIAESFAEVTGQLKALALPRSFWDRFSSRTLMPVWHNELMPAYDFWKKLHEGTNQPMSTISDP